MGFWKGFGWPLLWSFLIAGFFTVLTFGFGIEPPSYW